MSVTSSAHRCARSVGACGNAHNHLKARLWAKVRIPNNLDACWPWEGATSLKRYGERRPAFWDGGRSVNPARVICEMLFGPAPYKYHAGHTCPTGENKLCVNPRHLEWQSPFQNRLRRDSARRATADATF